MLSGKYEGGARPQGRLSLYSRFSRYFNPQSEAACSRYVALAREHGLDPAQMALAFVTQQPFVTSNIIGATTLEQLDSNIASFDLKLSRSAGRDRGDPQGSAEPGALIDPRTHRGKPLQVSLNLWGKLPAMASTATPIKATAQ
jgi:aryl-alcohol dehydrogenase-like predicted oxidoreductase